VALPLSYAETSTRYPVLWVTDNALELALAVLPPLELIIVSVGAPGGGFTPARAYDFYPLEDIHPSGPVGEWLREWGTARGTAHPGGGAPRFRDFLIDDVRTALAAEYRMDPDDHAIEGYSAGGWFVLYTMFTRPGGFAKHIAGAPAGYYCQNLLWEIEQQYADEHDDLRAQLFLGVGDGEMTTDHYFGCLSSTARMVELLSFRKYPSLELTATIYPGETHATSLPSVLAGGVRALWGDAIVRTA
jgi:predicted alpha/beta superfamily hydrolase